jgi:hypothetical protein
MTLGRQGERQTELMVGWAELPRSPGHAFYDRLQAVLVEAGFDGFAETRCEPYYATGRGRPSLPPGRYFRMHLVGYFEGIDSERGLEWRCADSLSLREFLRLSLREPVPDHSWLMWTATESQADFGVTPAPGGASQANRRFAPGVGGPCSLVRWPKRKPNPCRPSSQYSKQPRRPSRTPVRVVERSGQVRPYVRPVARPMPLAIMGVRSRARHQSERRARGAAKSAVSPGLSRPQPFPSRRSALPAGSAGAGPLSALLHRAPERHAVAPAATAARPFAR